MKEIKLTVKGMHCESCSILIKDILGDEEGVKSCEISREKETVKTAFDEEKIDVKKIKFLIENEGYEVD